MPGSCFVGQKQIVEHQPGASLIPNHRLCHGHLLPWFILLHAIHSYLFPAPRVAAAGGVLELISLVAVLAFGNNIANLSARDRCPASNCWVKREGGENPPRTRRCNGLPRCRSLDHSPGPHKAGPHPRHARKSGKTGRINAPSQKTCLPQDVGPREMGLGSRICMVSGGISFPALCRAQLHKCQAVFPRRHVASRASGARLA